MKGFRMLLVNYNVYIVAPSPNYDADYVKDVQQWTDDIVNVPAYGHLMFTNQSELLMGDYLIGADDVEGFMGATIRLGSETFKTWDDIIVYFSRLGGQ
jgi:5'(3')-deoxyribonucleotidase